MLGHQVLCVSPCHAKIESFLCKRKKKILRNY